MNILNATEHLTVLMVNFVNVFYHNKVIQENIPEIEDLNLLNESSVLKKINSG